jgi:hypothetical protein
MCVYIYIYIFNMNNQMSNRQKGGKKNQWENNIIINVCNMFVYDRILIQKIKFIIWIYVGIKADSMGLICWVPFFILFRKFQPVDFSESF